MTVGEKIRNRRIELNMSQEELAKKCGYKSRSSIQKIEASRDLPLKKVRAMASALGLKFEYLMGWEDFSFDYESNTWEIVNDNKQKDRYDKYGALLSVLDELSEADYEVVLSLAKSLKGRSDVK